MAKPYDRAWRRIRPAILQRDRYTCQIQGPACTIQATTVDHIDPLATRGSRLDPANLRAACWHCNSSLGATVGNRLREARSERWA